MKAYGQICIYFLVTECQANDWGRRGAYKCESLEAAVYGKQPILFSAFNMMSDWFSCFFFTEGVRGFPCLFLIIVFHGLACISLWSFATAIYGKPKCNSVHYLHNLVVNLVLILVILFYCIYSVQSSCVHSLQSIKGRATLKCGICK